MSPRKWESRIQDIIDAIQEIQDYTQGMTYTGFQSDLKTIRAVELNFIITGEACQAIPEQIQKTEPNIPWHLMRGMRNRIVHAYFSIDPQLVWDTIHNDLPILANNLKAMLQ